MVGRFVTESFPKLLPRFFRGHIQPLQLSPIDSLRFGEVTAAPQQLACLLQCPDHAVDGGERGQGCRFVARLTRAKCFAWMNEVARVLRQACLSLGRSAVTPFFPATRAQAARGSFFK